MLHPTYKSHPFERRAKATRSFERRLEVFDLCLALLVFVLAALLLSGL